MNEIIKNADGTYTIVGIEEIYLEIIIDNLINNNATAWLGQDIADMANIYSD